MIKVANNLQRMLEKKSEQPFKEVLRDFMNDPDLPIYIGTPLGALLGGGLGYGAYRLGLKNKTIDKDSLLMALGLPLLGAASGGRLGYGLGKDLK